MEWFLIYLFVMVERIGELFMMGWFPFWGGALLLVFGVGLSAAIACDNREHRRPQYTTFGAVWKDHPFATISRRAGYFLLIFGFIFGSMGFFVPKQKDMAIIVGAGLTYEAVTSEAGKRLGGKAIELLEAKINDALKDTTEPYKVKQGN